MNKLQTIYSPLNRLRRFESALTLSQPFLGDSPSFLAQRRQVLGQGGQAATFATRLLGRYLSQPGLWSRLGLVFKTNPPGEVFRTYQTWLKLAPRLSLKLALQTHSPAGPVGRRLRPPLLQVVHRSSVRLGRAGDKDWPLARRPVPEPVTKNIVRRIQSRETVELTPTQTPLVHHLITRGRRLEAGTHPGSAGAHPAAPTGLKLTPDQPGHLEAAPKAQPVPRVIQRSPQVQTEAEAVVGSGQFQAIRGTFAPPASHGQPLAQPPAININQLTDQVMQTLDRRFRAYRERIGRL